MSENERRCLTHFSGGIMLSMTVPAEKRRHTVAEYLAMEEQSEQRHEFHDGEILAMSGGTYGHSRTNTNLLIALGARLKGHRCHALDSNMRVRVPKRLRYVYPDTSIVCGPPQFDPDDPRKTTIVNPTVVIEVLSDSTERYDRGGKFDAYRDLPSLTEYVLISQHEALVETFLRQPDGSWRFTAWKGMSASVMLQSLNIEIPLSEIYQGVEFEPAPPPPPESREND